MRLLTTIAGRFFDALWLVNGNGTGTTSPKSKGIVDVVFGIAPDGRKSWRARGSGSAGQRPLLLAQMDGIDKILDLGDLTAEKEHELMCPLNKIGTVDIYIASHHGFNQSGSAVLVHAVAPRVAIVDNGAKKGGSPSALDIIRSSPNLAALWQLHFSEEAGPAHNTVLEFIANSPGLDAANYLKLAANPDGAFAVFNSRTKQSQQYTALPPR